MHNNNFSKLELFRNNFLPKAEPVDHCNSTTPTISNSTSTNCSHSREVGDKEICTGCNNPIEDKFLKRIMEDSWHEACLRCSACHGTLDGSCFLRDKQLLCRADYEKLFSVRCSGCGQIVFSQDLVMKVMNSNVYHVECFSCAVCRLPLQKGDHFVIFESQVYCRADFEKKMSNPAYFFHQLSPAHHFMNEWYRLKSEDECSSMDELEGEQGKGPKRPRTILTTSQRKKFKSSFEVNPKPCRKVREALAAETGLSVRVVQVWFQNQRAKMKKLARRQSDEGQTKKSKPRKEDEDGSEKSSPPSEAAVSVLNPDNITSQNAADSSNIFSHQELFANPGTDYGDLDHVAMKSGVTSSFILNPIDKLYSMQSSYFTVD